MTHNEFLERTGISMENESEQFARIHKVYVELDGLDKDQFCAQWAVMSQAMRDALVAMVERKEAQMANIIASNKVQMEQKQERIRELLNEKDEMVDFVYGQVKYHDVYEMKDFCKEHMGEGEFYARLIDDDEANSDDMERIAELLRENC